MANETALSPAAAGPPDNPGRRRFLTATTAVVGGVGVGFAAVPFIKSWFPSERAQQAGAPVTMDISALEEGQLLIGEWRGQPIWIVKRSKAILDALPTLDGHLRDPKSDNKDQQPAYIKGELRSIKPEILVLVGVCTHLGCVPIGDGAGDFGGWFCPCHGSHYDAAGRIRRGPAPENMHIPVAAFLDDATVKLG